MYKTPTFAEPQQCNRPFPTGQLSAFIIQLVTWQVLTRSERKNKISCNKNAIKNTEMLENYIYCIPIYLYKEEELSIQPRDFSLKYINRTESLIGGKINTASHVSFCIFSNLMKNYKNKLQNSSLLNVMRNFDQ
jgi:hypothetical protein